MANERTVDISKAIPHYQWEETYKNAGLSGNAVYEKDGGISYKVDAGTEDFKLIAETNEQRFSGAYSALTKSFPTLTAAELLDDFQTISEIFVRVNPKAESVIAYMRIDNPVLLDKSPAYAFIDLDDEQIKAAINVANVAAQEFTAATRRNINVKGLADEIRNNSEMESHYFEKHKDLVMSDLNRDIKNIQEVSAYYDEKRMERVLDWFYSKIHKELDSLWESYLKSTPYSDTKEFEELNKRIYAELEDICKDTCVKFENTSWAAYENYGRADRNLLNTLREAGDKLLTTFKDTCKEFLEGVKSFFKEAQNDIKQAGSFIKILSDAAREKMAAAHQSVSRWAADRVGSIKEHAASAKEAINDKAANIRTDTVERGLSIVEWAINSFENIKEKLSDKYVEIANAPKYDFDSLHKAEGFKSIDPNYSDIKSETTPFIKALGVRVDRDKKGNVTDIIYTPRLNKDELREVVSRSNEEIEGKTLTEWLEDHNVNVELSVTVPTEGISPAMALVSNHNGEMIGYTYIDLIYDEIEQITQVAREVGAKAVLIDDIVDKIRGEKFNEQNVKDWITPLKACSFNELSTISNTLNAMPSQDAREGWAMGYLAKTETVKDMASKRNESKHRSKEDNMERL